MPERTIRSRLASDQARLSDVRGTTRAIACPSSKTTISSPALTRSRYVSRLDFKSATDTLGIKPPRSIVDFVEVAVAGRNASRVGIAAGAGILSQRKRSRLGWHLRLP